jgi:subfamily B ATP-binding cassette protein MsbA
MQNLGLLIRLLGYLKPYRGRFVAALLCSALVAGFSGAYAWLIQPALDGIFINKDEVLLVLLPIVIVGVALGKAVANYGQVYLMNYVGNQVVADVREGLFRHLLKMPMRFHDQQASGRLLSHILNDVSLMSSAVGGVLKDIFQQGLTFLVMVGVICYQNWRLALASAVVVPLSLHTMLTMGRRLRSLATRGQENVGDMTSLVQEALTGIRIVKAFGREDHEASRFGMRNRIYFRTLMKGVQVSSLSSSQMEVIGVLGVASIVWYGGYLVIHGSMTPGAFFSFLAAMFMAYSPIRRLSGANNMIQQALSAAERVFSVLDKKQEQQAEHAVLAMPRITQSIEFCQVTFSYEGIERHALSAIDLHIRAGEIVAFVGSSGSGKSTLVSLVPRFYDPIDGVIRVDGVNIKEYTLDSLRSQIGIVSQETVLFDDTVASNIRYGKESASDEEVIQAAKAAYAHDFIERLSEGYQSVIGEKGVKLSGGERQRLAIARAILRDPPILILDEATSALDSESERIVQLALSNLMKNRTTLVIAHRLSTIQKADRIVVMDKGRIVETGTHEELLRLGGVYKRLHSIQFQEVGS